MVEIIPAILEKNYEDIVKKVQIISEASPWVQVDVADGIFAPNKTWPFIKTNDPDLEALIHEQKSLPEWESVSYEFDLMVSNPRAVADTFVTAGASRIAVHYGAFESDHEREVFLKDFKKKYNLPEPLSVKLGLAINIDKPVNLIVRYIVLLDFVQLMGIDHIGGQGEKFNEKTYERVAELRKLAPDLTISVDGGVKKEHLAGLVEAGVNRIIAGSAIWGSNNPAEEYEGLCDKIDGK